MTRGLLLRWLLLGVLVLVGVLAARVRAERRGLAGPGREDPWQSAVAARSSHRPGQRPEPGPGIVTTTEATPPPRQPRTPPRVLRTDLVALDVTAADKHQAIDLAGRLLVERAGMDLSVVASMHQRERQLGTHLGHGMAVPHATTDHKHELQRGAVAFLRLAEPVDWDGHPVRLVAAIACPAADHLRVLGSLARAVSREGLSDELLAAPDADTVLRLLRGHAPAAGSAPHPG